MKNIFPYRILKNIFILFTRLKEEQNMSKYILETNELTKVFGKQKAVNNVSLKIEENSVYGFTRT